MVEGVCATTGVLGDECLQLSIARRWPAAFDIEIFGCGLSARRKSPFSVRRILVLGILARFQGLAGCP